MLCAVIEYHKQFQPKVQCLHDEIEYDALDDYAVNDIIFSGEASVDVSQRILAVMGTKRPYDEDLQEFIKHPKHFDNGNKADSFGEGAVANMADMELEANAPLPLVTGISGHEEDARPGPVLCSNLFPEFFEFNMPRRQLVHYDDTYSSLLISSPRKDVPVGPEHQADVPEFDPGGIKYGDVSDDEREEGSMGVCIIPTTSNSSYSFPNEEVETANPETNCKCSDIGSIRCVQQHVNEARMKLQESLGLEKFVNLGLNEMGEEVAGKWTEEDEQLFQDVVYSNPVSLGKRFWEQLSIAFPSRTKKELVSYYYNVFMLRRRAVQNRSNLLEIDSDDDEWWGSRRGPSGPRVEDGEFVVVAPFDDHGDHDTSHEDGDDNGGGHEREGEGDIVVKVQDFSCTSFDDNQSTLKHDDKVTNESRQEKPVNVNKQEANSSGLRSESYLHWDPPYSTMGSTKGVDLLPTCSMIEEIFGSSKTGKST